MGKKVLELGSGTGVLGIFVALLGPKELYLTDLNEYLGLLNKNILLNEHNWNNLKLKVVVMPLKWNYI